MSHFRVGQMVLLGKAGTSGAPHGRWYKVLSALELPNGSISYRIKSIAEASDRIVAETGIEAGPPPFRVISRGLPLHQDLVPWLRPEGA